MPRPRPSRNAADGSGRVGDAFDADVFKIDRSECVESEWESDDDVPLATLHGDREPTLAELLARTKRDADTQLKKASIALERPCPTVSSPGIPDSVMNRLSKAANEVMNRIVGLKPTPLPAFHGLSYAGHHAAQASEGAPVQARGVGQPQGARPSRWRRDGARVPPVSPPAPTPMFV